MLVHVVGILLLTAFAVEGQILLEYNQIDQELDIRCSVNDTGATNITVPVSLVLSRMGNGTNETLVSVAFLNGTAPHISHDLKNEMVTSGASQDGGSGSYVNVHWDIATIALQGPYVCTLNGLDSGYSPVWESERKQLTLNITGLQPVLQASPDVIDIGVTRFFNLRCSFSDLVLQNVSEIQSIELSQEHNKTYRLLGTVSMFSEAIHKQPENPQIKISGSVNTSESDAYLDIQWEHPDHEHAGEYNCDILGLDLTGTPVHFSRIVDVKTVDPGLDVLIAKIHRLEASVDDFQQAVLDCDKTKTEPRALPA